ncbi:hypothetical protein DY000_02050614 [Brassica cretica]|uniref:9-cis-epoxycarotenoid dioxygenase n=1 Tax=Brassica cretica TaxID=69181 RepID=A0ABQ7F6H9_BRACR|nr:hypothetical protein DY000_02050614 [Brassica cretica]
MSSSNYFRSWIDRPHLDPNTRLLTEEYQRGITEFMGLVHRQPEAKTDDGHILCFVHDEKTWKSELEIVNAVSLEVEATVKLPSRVPYGFHGTFIGASDLAKQV